MNEPASSSSGTDSARLGDRGAGAGGPDDPRYASLRDLTEVCFKYKERILVAFLVTVLTVYAILLLIPAKFDANASLLVQLGPENAAVPATVTKEAFVQGGVTQDQVNSEIAAFQTPSLIAATADAVGIDVFFADPPRPSTFFGWLRYGVRALYRQARKTLAATLCALDLQVCLEGRNAVIATISGALTVTGERDARVINVTVRLPNAWLAAEVANKLVERHLIQRGSYFQSSGAAQMFAETVALRRTDLAEAERRLQEFRAKWGVSALSEQREAALRQLARVDEKIMETEAATTHTQAQVESLKAQLADLPRGLKAQEITRDPVGQGLAERAAGLYQERSRLLANFRPDSRFVSNVDREIHEIEGQMASERRGDYGSTTTAANPNHQAVERSVLEVEAQLTGLDAERTLLADQHGRLQDKLETLDGIEAESRTVERQRQLAEQVLLSYQQKVEETRIAEEITSHKLNNLVVLSPATPPVVPSRPRKLLIMGIALLGGLVAGIALAFISDLSDRSVRSDSELAHLGLAVLATVPKMDPAYRPAPELYDH